MVTGLALELDGGAAERYPFAATAIRVGDEITDAVEWRDIPVGLLPAWQEPPDGIATYDVAAGHPLLPGVGGDVIIPAGAWSLQVPLPVATPPGTHLRLLNSITGDQIDGVVASAGFDNGFETTAMVAFSADDAPRAAQAIAGDAFVVMIGHGASASPANG